MSLKDALIAEQTRKREAEEAARRPYEEARSRLKALYDQIWADQDVRNQIGGEVEWLGDQLQIDPGPILIRVTVDQAGDYALSYEIKSAHDPVTKSVAVASIPEIETALARLLVEYEDHD